MKIYWDEVIAYISMVALIVGCMIVVISPCYFAYLIAQLIW